MFFVGGPLTIRARTSGRKLSENDQRELFGAGKTFQHKPLMRFLFISFQPYSEITYSSLTKFSSFVIFCLSSVSEIWRLLANYVYERDTRVAIEPNRPASARL